MKYSGKKIAIFLPSLAGGGAERAMLNLAHGLGEKGIAVDLVLAQATGPYLKEVRKSVRIVDLKAQRVLASLPALTRYLISDQPDSLLSALDYANILAIWARRFAGQPSYVAVNEQNTVSKSARNSSRRRQRFIPFLVKHFYPWADCIIGNSQGVAEDLSRLIGLPPEKVTILYNPVITPDVREKARQPIEHPWFEKDQPPVLLAVGRLTKQKDFPSLIKAFHLVSQTHPARLIILGEGPDREALEQLIKQLGLENKISMPGFVENPYSFMANASMYILSSRWEGLPTVLIEALYCGPKIIATDCPSGPREILADGRYGSLVPVGDITALAGAIEAGFTGDIPNPSPESWKPYTLEVIVDQYEDLLLNRQTGKSRYSNPYSPAKY